VSHLIDKIMQLKTILIIGGCLVFICCFIQCKGDSEPVNIVLYNQPLSVIQKSIKGSWSLKYIYGGISPQKITEKNKAYMILAPNHITLGDDVSGTTADTTIVWVNSTNIFNQQTYLMSFQWEGNIFPEYKIVDQIKNDTLIIIDNAYDGYSYYYVKTNQ
jgi:hypothetical protein